MFLSSCWVWGRLLLSLFWCDCSAFFLGHLRFSAACHAAGYPSRVPHLAASGQLTSSSHRGSAPLAGAATFLAPVCWSTPAVVPCGWVGGVFAASLGFFHVPCSSSGPAACAAFPAAGYLVVFHRVGVLLACGVSGVCGLRRRSRLPFVCLSSFSCVYCPSPFLGLGWLGHRFVALLRLLGFGLF